MIESALPAEECSEKGLRVACRYRVSATLGKVFLPQHCKRHPLLMCQKEEKKKAPKHRAYILYLKRKSFNEQEEVILTTSVPPSHLCCFSNLFFPLFSWAPHASVYFRYILFLHPLNFCALFHSAFYNCTSFLHLVYFFITGQPQKSILSLKEAGREALYTSWVIY